MSITFMLDDHTFRKLDDDPEVAAEQALALFDSEPLARYGLMGSEDPRAKHIPNVHSNGNREEFAKGLLIWCKECVMAFKTPLPITCPRCQGKGTVPPETKGE